MNAGSEEASCGMAWQLVNECSERLSELSPFFCHVACERESAFIFFYFCGVALQRVNECGMRWGEISFCDVACEEQESELSFSCCDVAEQRVS